MYLSPIETQATVKQHERNLRREAERDQLLAQHPDGGGVAKHTDGGGIAHGRAASADVALAPRGTCRGAAGVAAQPVARPWLQRLLARTGRLLIAAGTRLETRAGLPISSPASPKPSVGRGTP